MQDRKNILLIGFNGRIGSEIAKSLIKNNNVYCLMRSAPKMGINSIFLKFIDGDADSLEDLRQALEQKDAVVSAYGNADKQAVQVYTAKLIQAMEQKKVKRLVVIGSSGALTDSSTGKSFVESHLYPENWKQKAIDHMKAAKLIAESKIDYTIVCPHKLIDGQSDSPLKVLQKVQKQMDGVHTYEIAKWINQELLNNKWVNKTVGLTD